MTVASFDVGMKNLALCVLDEDASIRDWRVIDLGTTNTHEATARVVESLDQLSAVFDGLSVVCIESQPHHNPKMKQVATAIQVYFICRRPDTLVKFVSPRNKLAAADPTPRTYNETKRAAVALCARILQEDGQASWLEKIRNCSKADDLADAYLQGRAVLVSMGLLLG